MVFRSSNTRSSSRQIYDTILCYSTFSLFVTPLSLRGIRFTAINRLLSRAPVITLMYDLSPPEFLALVLDILDSGEVVLILFHSRDPWYVIERHDFKAEILVVLDLLDSIEERVEVRRRLVIDVG